MITRRPISWWPSLHVGPRLSYVGFATRALPRPFGTGYEFAADSPTPAASSAPPRSPTAASPSGGSATQLAEDGVRVDVALDPAPTIPSDADAIVATRGGRRAVRRPAAPAPRRPVLEDGDVIPRAHRRIPVRSSGSWSTSTTCRLASTRSLGGRRRAREAFEGAGDSLERLSTAATCSPGRAEDSLTQTLELLRDGGTVLDTQVEP